jgi:hypothetical protein
VLEYRILSRTRGEFTDREIEGLAGPVLRYLRAAIAIGTQPSANGISIRRGFSRLCPPQAPAGLSDSTSGALPKAVTT